MEHTTVLSVVSLDSTRIAFERSGDGPPLIFVVGAFNERNTAQPLAGALAAEFSGITYDRRGRGDSSDTPPYAVEREIEDLQALIDEAGGSAVVFGFSSGAVLAAKAAVRGLSIAKLVLHDPPYGLLSVSSIDHAVRLQSMISEGRRGEAVEYFQREIVGIPPEVVLQLRHAPFRPALERIAHTLVYEALILQDTRLASELESICIPTLVLTGTATPPSLRTASRALANAIPGAQLRELEGLTHDIVPEAIAPAVTQFLHQ